MMKTHKNNMKTLQQLVTFTVIEFVQHHNKTIVTLIHDSFLAHHLYLIPHLPASTSVQSRTLSTDIHTYIYTPHSLLVFFEDDASVGSSSKVAFDDSYGNLDSVEENRIVATDTFDDKMLELQRKKSTEIKKITGKVQDSLEYAASLS